MATLRDTALPAQGNTSWYGHYTALDEDVRRTNVGVVQADSFAGADDGAKLQTALTWAAAQTYRPWVQFPARLFSVGSQTYQTYSGMRLCGPGASEGARNPEQGTALTTHQVQFTGGTGASSMFVTSGGSQFGISMASVQFQGGAASQIWHTDSTVYSCQLHNLSWQGGKHFLGSPTAKFLNTQLVTSGHWTVLNYTDTPFTFGGSDSHFSWYLNSQSPASVAGAGKPIIHFDYQQKSDVSFLYLTVVNGWRGLRVTGSADRDLTFYHSVFEGANDGNVSTYSVIDMQGGRATFWHPRFAWVDDVNTNGVVEQSGGQLDIHSPVYERGSGVTDSFPLLYQTGGTARIYDATMTNGSQPRVRWSSGAVETLPAFANGASGPVRTLTKAGALAANDFAGICAIGSLAVDTTNGKLYICTATNGTTTSTWVVVGTQT